MTAMGPKAEIESDLGRQTTKSGLSVGKGSFLIAVTQCLS
jgi:hypothetical protein